jgi:hypothetical protein
MKGRREFEGADVFVGVFHFSRVVVIISKQLNSRLLFNDGEIMGAAHKHHTWLLSYR